MDMKLSDKTLTVLKNFAGINNSILVKQGNSLRTMSVAKNISLDTIDNYFVTLLCPAQLYVPITHNCPRYS